MSQTRTDFLETSERTFEITTPAGTSEEQIISHLHPADAWTCDIEHGTKISAKVKALRIEARTPTEGEVTWLVRVVFLLKLAAWQPVVSAYYDAQDALSYVTIWPTLPADWDCLSSE